MASESERLTRSSAGRRVAKSFSLTDAPTTVLRNLSGSASKIYVPVRTADCIALINHAAAKLLNPLTHLSLHGCAAGWNTNVSRRVREMIAHHRPALAGPFDDAHKCVNRLTTRRPGIVGDPLVHLSNARGRSVSLQKLLSVQPPSLGHQLGLPADCPTASCDPNVSLRELALYCGDKVVHRPWPRRRSLHDRHPDNLPPVSMVVSGNENFPSVPEHDSQFTRRRRGSDIELAVIPPGFRG